MTVSADYAGAPAPGAAHELAGQVADVAAAMFALLLVQTPDRSAPSTVPPAAMSALPQASEELPASIALPLVPELGDAVPDVSPPPAAPIAPASIAMPTPVPVADPQAVDVPLAAGSPRTMAMLSEIGFLDD